MTADLYVATISGATVVQSGLQAFSMSLICGVSGTAVIPIRVLSDGSIATSGA